MENGNFPSRGAWDGCRKFSAQTKSPENLRAFTHASRVRSMRFIFVGGRFHFFCSFFFQPAAYDIFSQRITHLQPYLVVAAEMDACIKTRLGTFFGILAEFSRICREKI